MHIDLVDVFGSAAMKGNPLAVVHGAEGLSEEQMLQLTQWLGFSETTFILPPSDPQADYAVRIFYPAGELPFAGHPTLGTCHSWLEQGGSTREAGRIVQECGIGLVTVRRDGEELALAAPGFSRYGSMSAEETAEAIALAGVDPATVVEAVHVNNGPQWKLLRLRSSADVLAADPAPKAPAGMDLGLAGPHPAGSPIDWELRAFFTNQQGRFVEDPVTGSFNASVARHLFESGEVDADYVAGQGQKTGADGRISCNRDADGSVWIGGLCYTISRGGSLPVWEAVR